MEKEKRKVGLISCTKSKREGKHRAESLYTSPLFKKSFEYSLRRFDNIHLLSAKHGVLDLDEKIECYDKTLNNMDYEEREKWSKRVASELNEKYSKNDTLFFLCGKRYYELVTDYLEIPYQILMEGMGIGERLHWLNKKLDRTLFFSSYLTNNFFPRQIMSYKEANDRTLNRCRVSFIDSGILEEERKIRDIVEKQGRGDFIASVDVLEDINKTVDNTLKWEDMTEGISKNRKVYVLQGKNKIDYMECFKELEGSIDDMKYLGLGGLIKKDGKEVKEILLLIPKLKKMGYNVHVFGIGIRYISLIRRLNPYSWDSSTPVRDAIDGKIYTSNLNKRDLGNVNPRERGWIAMWNARKIQSYLDDGQEDGQKTIISSIDFEEEDYSNFLKDRNQVSLNRFFRR